MRATIIIRVACALLVTMILIGLTVEEARAQWVGYGVFLPLIRR